MLKRLRVANFQIEIKKCECFIIEIKYSKLIISINNIKMNLAKTKIIVKWNIFINLKYVRLFINFCDFYRRFIQKFSKKLNHWTFSSGRILYLSEIAFVMLFFESSKTEFWKRRFFVISIEKAVLFKNRLFEHRKRWSTFAQTKRWFALFQ